MASREGRATGALRWLAFAAALCAACAVVVRDDAGIGLQVSFTHRVGSAPGHAGVHYDRGAERGLLTDQGYGVTLERALLVFGELRLMACDGDTADASFTRAGAPRRVWRSLLSAIGPAVARAHGESSPFVHATPVVFDLMDKDRNVRLLASMAPPPGRYCSMRLRVAPADDDADGLEIAPDIEDHSMLVAGRVARSSEGRDEHFQVASKLEDALDVPFPAPLELSEDQPSAHVLFELSYGTMLDGVDLDGPVDPLGELQIIRNLLQPISARICTPECQGSSASY